MASTPNASAPERITPAPVKIVSLLALLVGFFSVIAGVLLILAALGNAASLGQSPFWLAAQGVLYLVLGMVALVVYRDLNKGENWARLLFTAVLVIGVLTNLARAIGGRELNAWWGVAVDVVALIALYVPQQCREFFAASTQ